MLFLFSFFVCSKSELSFSIVNDALTITGSGGISQDDINAYASPSTIKSVTIGEGITKIWDNSFFNCVLLQNITIPSTLDEIGHAPFRGCKSLSKFDVSLSNEFFSNDEQGAFYNKGKTILFRASLRSEFVVPDTVTTIKNGAFTGYSTINRIVLSNSLTTLEMNSFNELTFGSIEFKDNPSLTVFPSHSAQYIYGNSIMIPKSCITIETYAFLSAVVSEIIFQKDSQLKEIKENAFEGNYELVSIILPESLTTIGEYAFAGNSKLKLLQLRNNQKYLQHNRFLHKKK